MSVMGADGGTAGYIAESLDPQRSNFEFNRGGGATAAMYDKLLLWFAPEKGNKDTGVRS
jgi:hypothetical protein